MAHIASRDVLMRELAYARARQNDLRYVKSLAPTRNRVIGDGLQRSDTG